MKRMKTFFVAAFAMVILMGAVSLGIAPAFAEGDVAINEENFPDEIFRTYVSETIDHDHNGTLSQSELAEVREIDLREKGIRHLKGVEYFTYLETLWCNSNDLTELDISHNLALKELYCMQNQLQNVDIAKHTALINFDCSSNRIKSLDVGNNKALEGFWCQDNQLTALDISQNTALITFNASVNQLKRLDVSHNRALEGLYCYGNQLEALDISQNTALIFLNCGNNQLKNLELSKNIALEGIDCNNNQLKRLDVSHQKNLEWLYCHDNQLCSMDLSHHRMLQDFNGDGQNYPITIGKESLTFDLTSLPGGFDVTKASEWVGGSLSGTTLRIDSTKPAEVRYKYQAGGGHFLEVALNTIYGDKDEPPASPLEKIEVRLAIGSEILIKEINGISKQIIMDVVPYIKEGRTMLPIRFIAEALGLEVQWLEERRTVILKGRDYSAEIPVDTNKIIVGGITYEKDVKPEIKYGRTMLPLRHVAEALGFDVTWTAETETVTIGGKA